MSSVTAEPLVFCSDCFSQSHADSIKSHADSMSERARSNLEFVQYEAQTMSWHHVHPKLIGKLGWAALRASSQAGVRDMPEPRGL